MPIRFVTISKNSLILLLVNLSSAAGGFLLAILLARSLGDAGFGRYNFVFTWLLSLMIIAEFGLSTVLTRDLAARPHLTTGYLLNSLAAKLLVGLPAILALLLLAPRLAATPTPEGVAALRWGSLFLLAGLAYSSFTAVFRAQQHMLPILYTTLAGQGLLLAGSGALIWRGASLAALIAWTGLSQSASLGLALLLFRRTTPPSPARTGISKTFIKMLLRRAWPFALAGLLAALQLRANILILAYLAGDAALGWYTAANRFTEAGKQLPAAFFGAMLPALAALAGQPTQQQTVRQARLALLAFSLAAVTGAFWLGDPLIRLVYGPDFLPAVAILQVLTLALIPNLQNSLLIIFLYAQGHEQFVNGIIALGIVINLGLCLLLIPAWGAIGPALALLAAESAVLLPYHRRATQLFC